MIIDKHEEDISLSSVERQHDLALMDKSAFRRYMKLEDRKRMSLDLLKRNPTQSLLIIEAYSAKSKLPDSPNFVRYDSE